MGMTMTQKILAQHAGLKSVEAGQLIKVPLDLLMANDTGFPLSLKEYQRSGAAKVFDPSKIVLVMDHCTPNKDVISAENCRQAREFADKKQLEHFYDVGQMGIEHVLLPEKGFVAPGELIVGGDSHTCTYGALGAFSTGMGSTDIAAALITGEVWLKVPAAIRINLTGKLRPYVSGKDVVLTVLSHLGVSGALYRSLEYTGPGVTELTMDDRFTIANMSIECGAKNGIFPVDDCTKTYLEERIHRPYQIYEPDSDAEYVQVLEINLEQIVPMVAFPHLPANGRPVAEIQSIPVNQVFIGSCTNGRISDLAAAAAIIKGRKVAKGVRTIVVPATQNVYKEALQKGYLETFINAGCAVATPGCGACAGGHMGLLGRGEVALATSNRNFVGRMGHIESKVYLASPATAAATAICGVISGPEQVMKHKGVS